MKRKTDINQIKRELIATEKKYKRLKPLKGQRTTAELQYLLNKINRLTRELKRITEMQREIKITNDEITVTMFDDKGNEIAVITGLDESVENATMLNCLAIREYEKTMQARGRL